MFYNNILKISQGRDEFIMSDNAITGEDILRIAKTYGLIKSANLNNVHWSTYITEQNLCDIAAEIRR